MKKILIALLFVLSVGPVTVARGHGFLVSTNNGKLTLISEDSNAGGLPLYTVQSMLGPANFKSADHPGYDVQGGITAGASISFDVLGPLWYSTGGAPVPSPVDMSIVPQDILVPGSVTVTGSSGFQTGFLIGEYDGANLGAFEHQLNYSIAVPGSVPIGAYAVALQLTGMDSGGSPYTPSDPFVAVFNNGLSVGSLPAVSAQLYGVAVVPEPSSIVLAVVAGMALLFARRRSKQ